MRIVTTEMGRAHGAARQHRSRLEAAPGISALIFGVELVAGIASNSLTLVADAGHVIADAAGMALSLVAIWLADRPATGARTFGLYRLELASRA